jgi:hypothetical protein
VTFTLWYVIMAVGVLLVAAACLFDPRTRRAIGPGILLGNAAVSAAALVGLIVSGLTEQGLRSGYWLVLAANLAAVSAACVAGAAVVRAPEIRLPHWPARTMLAWIVILIGAAAAVTLLIYAHELSAAGVGQDGTAITWTAVAAIVVPLVATSAVPARFATALLGGWLGASVVAFVNFALIYRYQNQRGTQVNSAPVIAFGVLLAALIAATTIFARAAARHEA